MKRRIEGKLAELAPTPPTGQPQANTAPMGTTVKPTGTAPTATTTSAGAPAQKQTLSPQGIQALGDLLKDVAPSSLSQIIQKAK